VPPAPAFAYDAENRLVNVNNGAATYTYDAAGERMRKDSGGSYTEYQYLNGQPIAEKHSDGTWSDYIYANGQKIARADSYDVRIHFTGTNCSNCGSPQGWAYRIPVSANTIQAGDKIAWRQYQTGPAVPRGGLGIAFTDGVYTNWVTYDQDGQEMNNDATQNAWHYRVADLSQYAGKTIDFAFVVEDTWSGPGDWQEYFSDIAFLRQDGTVQPIYNRQTNVSYSGWGYPGGTNERFEVNTSNSPADAEQPLNTTTYYIGDHLGSTRLEVAGSGLPVSSSTFYPFGQEQSATADNNHYKFTGKERDTESGLDHFEFRNYASTMGRWMSPDPRGNSVADFANPQSWNMYSYVLNNPLKYVDPFGLDCAYLNDVGNGIESSDRSSSIGECGKTGGYWVSGAVNTVGFRSDGSMQFGNNSVGADGTLQVTVYDKYLGPNTDNSLSSAYGAASSLLSDFLTGNGPTVRNYDLSTIEGRNFLQSKGVQQLNARIKAGCAAGQQSGAANLSSGQAAANIPYDAANSPVGGQVGGYAGGTYTNNGDSTDISFTNVAGAHSFVYHATPDRPSGSTGPGRSIIQNFTLSEPNPCTHP
jgi:RHS repeat-associated protein